MATYPASLIAQIVREFEQTVMPHFARGGDQDAGRRAGEDLVARYGRGPVEVAMAIVDPQV
ncbi:hypothetical protein [Streptomyces sp. NPDC050255]|uniref:hypothetical protein n=1 Tax=Streptomyces sp. NPDC050255 TaxID=3365606 RepID=UPI0037A0C174